MAVVRTVYIPLSREPEILFGLKLSDLLWVGAAGAADLGLWTRWTVALTLRILAIVGLSAAGLLLGLVRIHEASLPEWLVRWALFWLRPRLYLP